MGSRGGVRRWALPALVGCIALLVLAPGALAAGGTGKISGTVTAAGSHADLKNIEVSVYEASGEFPFPVESAVTNANGEYTVEGLATGSYEVEFAPAFKSGLNYITQYYNDQPSLADANSVAVTSGSTKSGIDAEMQEGGGIEGRVTGAVTHQDLESIEVTAFEAGGNKSRVGSASTDKNGEYAIVGLATGSYTVEFSPGLASGLNYVTQYYEGQSSLASANSVAVVQGSTKAGIDAELQVGGEISGTVTDASTHAGLSEALIVVFGAGEVLDGIAVTDASGNYTVEGLATGSYVVEFLGEKYIAQFYNGQSSFAKANLVTVVQQSMTTGINAAMVRKAPVNTGAPVASGTPAVGQTLSCSNGSWTGSPAPVYTHAWLRDGVPITGATAGTYVVQSADVGNGLTCKVTASNKSGAVAALSNTLIVPIPSPPPPSPIIELSSSKLVVSGNSAHVPIICAGATCTGTIELTERIVVKRRKGRRTISRKETVVLAKGSYSMAAGTSTTIAVRLTSAGKSALAAAKHHRLSAKLSASVLGGATRSITVVLSEPAPKRKHGRR